MLSDAERQAASIAESQAGLISYADLLDAGMSAATILRRVRTGDLQKRRPGVYAFAGTPRLPQQSLVEAAISVDRAAAVSHDSAAHVWGLISHPPPVIHVVVRRWRREHRAPTKVHESLDFIPRDRTLREGVPVTVPARTIVDLGATSHWLVESALDRGLRSGVLELDEIAAFVRRVARRGRRGVGVIRPLLEFRAGLSDATDSVLETKFLRLLSERGLEQPSTQLVIRDPSNAEFICRVDFAYPDCLLQIELDGRTYHSDHEAFQSDRTKQNRLQQLGWTTLRFTWDDVTRRPDYTVTTVLRTLRRLRSSVLA